MEDAAGARDLAEAVNCSGGTFNVEWRGSVVVDATIAVGHGSALNITGVGENATVDGGGETQLFVVSGAYLSLNGLQLSNGFYPGLGPIVSGGAAIYANGSTLVLQNTAFLNNIGKYSAYGGAIRADDCTVSFSGKTTMVGNYAIYGAGVYIEGEEALLSWSGVSVFSNNTCNEYGCAVFAINVDRVSWAGDTTFEINESETSAGAALSLQGVVSASWSGRTRFIGNVGRSFAGAVYAVDVRTLAWKGETLFNNNSGAIYVSRSTCTWEGTMNFSDNRPDALYRGGALHIIGSNVSWSGQTLFTGNLAPTSGGAMYVDQSNVCIGGETVF